MVKRQNLLPQRIEPFRLAEAGRSLRGRLSLQRMQRLAPLLASADGKVEVELKFEIDADGRPRVVGSLRTDLQLVCQRCMEPMRFPVDTGVALTFVTHESEAEHLQGSTEVYVIDSEPLALADLIEDELLLCLPQVALHPLQECPAREALETLGEAQETSEQKDNPFAVLAKLRTQEPE